MDYITILCTNLIYYVHVCIAFLFFAGNVNCTGQQKSGPVVVKRPATDTGELQAVQRIAPMKLRNSNCRPIAAAGYRKYCLKIVSYSCAVWWFELFCVAVRIFRGVVEGKPSAASRNA